MVDVRYLIYAMVGVAVALGAEAAFKFLSSSRSYRQSVNGRLRVLDRTNDRTASLVELRRQRSLSAEGRYILPVIWLNRLVMQSGVRLHAQTWIVVMLGLTATTWTLSYVLEWNMVLSAVLALIIGVGIPLQFLRIVRDRRIRRFESQLPDGIDAMVRSLRAGHPVPIALSTVAREAPDPLGSEFGMAFDEVTYGLDVETAVANMRARVGQADLALLVVAVSIQAKTGGNLAEILANLSKVLRERFRMKRKVRALSAEGRFSAIALSLLPFIVSGAVFLTAPTFYTDVWNDPVFTPVLIFALLLMMTGDYIMYRMVRFRF
jgi:tight adherence protein B